MMEYTILNRDNSKMWKAIAAAFIAGGHCLSSHTPLAISFWFSGNLWVGLFFFFSGYGLQLNNKKEGYLRGFILKKIVNIYMPFVIAELIFTVIYMICNSETYSVWKFMRMCFGLQLKNDVLWYVIELLIIEFIFYFFERCIQKNRIKAIAWIIAYVVFLGLAVYFDIATWWYISTSCFFIGLWFDSIKEIFNYISKHKKVLITYCLVFVIIYVPYKCLYDVDLLLPIRKNYVWTALNMILAPMFVILCVILSQFMRENSKLLVKLGNISYEYYLYHMCILIVLEKMFSNAVITFFGTVILTSIISIPMHYLNKVFSSNCLRLS